VTIWILVKLTTRIATHARCCLTWTQHLFSLNLQHDLFGKLSRESLASVARNVSRFPDEQTVKNAFALSAGWKSYKADLIRSVLANKKVGFSSGSNSTLE